MPSEEYPPMAPVEPPPKALLDKCTLCGSNDITCRRKGVDPLTKQTIFISTCEDCKGTSIRLVKRTS